MAMMALRKKPPQEVDDLSEDAPRFLLHTDWTAYTKMLEALRDQRCVRVTYDDGGLELLTLSPEHELLKDRFGRLFELFLMISRTPFYTAGSTTFKRRKLNKGLEPDRCYWLENWNRVAGIKRWNPTVHPPPDLMLEIEVSCSVLDRLGILADLKVPEVWRCSSDEFHMLGLSKGKYVPLKVSRVVPQFDPTVLLELLRRKDVSEDQLMSGYLARLTGSALTGGAVATTRGTAPSA